MTVSRVDQRPGLGGRKLTGEQVSQVGLLLLYTENEEVNQKLTYKDRLMLKEDLFMVCTYLSITSTIKELENLGFIISSPCDDLISSSPFS